MEQNVAPPERAEQVIPSVVVVVAHTHAGLPTGAADSRLLSYVCEGAVAIVLVQMSRGYLPFAPVSIQPIAVRQIDIDPSVVVIVEKSNPAAFGFDDEPLVLNSTPNIGDVEAGSAGHVE